MTKTPNSIVPWMGGKTKLIKKILPYFPEHTCYAEPFAGSAALFFAKERAQCEVINDSNGELSNLYRVIQYHRDAFIDLLTWFLTSREMFDRLNHTEPQHLTDIGRAIRFFYLQKHAFGAKAFRPSFGTATVSPRGFNSERMIQSLKRAHARLLGVYVEHLDWHALVKKYDRKHTLFYLDPPYWGVAGYGVSFPWQEYQKIKEVMETGQGMVILSINDHPDIRALFKGFAMKELTTTYSPGKRAQTAKELLIFNQQALDALPKNLTETL